MLISGFLVKIKQETTLISFEQIYSLLKSGKCEIPRFSPSLMVSPGNDLSAVTPRFGVHSLPRVTDS